MSSPDPQALGGERRTIASIEMLDAIELEALLGEARIDAFKPPRALRNWIRQWIITWRPRRR